LRILFDIHPRDRGQPGRRAKACGNNNRPSSTRWTGRTTATEGQKHGVFALGLEGVGQPGRLSLLEARVDQHERTVQRMKGVGGGLSVLLTLLHVCLDFVKR
jgi:hypothetical protein